MIRHPQGTELQLDTAPADWIADRMLSWGRDVGTRVCAIVPTGYDAYVRVFPHRWDSVSLDEFDSEHD